jgi:hypothetical protein
MGFHPGQDTFGWHDEECGGSPSGVDDGGQPATFDKFDVTTYLHSNNNADGSFAERFILNVNGFELNGAPVDVAGFGTKFGMYFLIDATGQATNGVTTFNTMNIKLMVDRGADDGAPSSTQAAIGFEHGTRGDYALLQGTLKSATLDISPDGTRHPNYVETITPTADGWKLLRGSVTAGDLLQELLTTPGGPQTISTGDGKSINLVNGWGFGTVGLTPDTPLTIRAGQFSRDGDGHSGGCCWTSSGH